MKERMCSIQNRDSNNSEHLFSFVDFNPAEKGTFPGFDLQGAKGMKENLTMVG
jgi:hypothetical protein